MEKLEDAGKLSIIVPVYNVEKYAAKCIESLLNQSYRNIEIILIDDGSTDHSLRICEQYAKKDDRIVIIRKRNGGVSSARNEGLRACTGQLVTFVDSDDYIDADIYRKLIPIMQEQQCEMAAFGVRMVDETGAQTGKVQWPSDKILETRDEFYCELFKKNAWIYNKIFRRELLQGRFFNETMVYCEDSYFTLTLMNDVTRIYVSSELGYYRLEREGSATNQRLGRSNLNDLENSLIMYELLKKNGYGWIGAYRVSLSVRRTLSKVSMLDWKENKSYIDASVETMKKVADEDYMDYVKKNHVSFGQKLQEFFIKRNVYVWLWSRRLIRKVKA